MGERIAVIGAGVAGISAAYHLRDSAELTLFERNEWFGGHANTISVVEDDREIGMDTGFLVCNGRSYPQLMRFFDELGVRTTDHRGGFNFVDLDAGLQFGTPEFELEEDEVSASYSPEFLDLWRQARRFYRTSQRDFIRGRTNVPLGEYLDRKGFTEEFKHSYVIQVATAVWSIPPELIWEMPAATLIAFFMLHDPDGLGGRSVEWKTVAGGSRTYVRRALEEIEGTDGTVVGRSPVRAVREAGDGVEVVTDDGTDHFDLAIVATHADEALELVERPRAAARRVLEQVRYNPAKAVIHRDASVLHAERERWQSWNYTKARIGGETTSWITYYLNHILGLDARHDYFETLDPPVEIREDLIVREIDYTHPVITVAVRDMQDGIYGINEDPDSRIKFCGSYFHSREMGPDLIASHEAAFSSGAETARLVKEDLRRHAATATARR